MVKIRLRRTGAKKKPSYRVVVTESSAPRDGRFIEIIGHYNPRTDPVTLSLQEDRALHWLSVGAQPTDTVKKILDNAGTLDRFARMKEGADLEELLAEATTAREQNAVEAPVEKAPKASEVVEESSEQAEEEDTASEADES